MGRLDGVTVETRPLINRVDRPATETVPRAVVVTLFLLTGLVLSGCARAEEPVLGLERLEESDRATPPSASPSPPVLTVTATHDAVPLAADFPVSWSDVEHQDWIEGDGAGVKVGHALIAANDVDDFYGDVGLQVPGAFVGVSDTLLQSWGVDTGDTSSFFIAWAETVAQVTYGDATCEYRGVSDVSVAPSFALRRAWTGCAGGELTVVDFWSANPETGQVVTAVAAVSGENDIESAEGILASVAHAGVPVVEFARR